MRQAALAVAVGLALAPAQAPAASTMLPAAVVQKAPISGARLTTFFPVLSATLQRADPNSVHLFVDGRDVTQRLSVNGTQLQYIPQERMSIGWHDVFLEGVGRDHRRFSDAWAFETRSPEGTGVTSPQMGNFEFLPSGGFSFFPGQLMHFFLIAPVNGFATLQLCGLGEFPFQQVPFSPVFFVTVGVPVTPFPTFFDCQIAALFTPFNGFNTILVPLPVGINIFSRHGHTVIPVIRGGTDPVVSGRTTMPVGRMPGFGTPIMSPGTIPVTAPRPVSNPMPVQFPVSVPRPIGVPHPISMPRPIGVPHPISAPHPISIPHPVVAIPHP